MHRLRLHLPRRLFSTTPTPPRTPLLTAQLRTLTLTLQSFFLLHLFWDHFYSLGLTSGASMLPTINTHGDFILVSKLHSRGRGVAVGDLVSYVHPVDGPGVHVCKRVVGMPGDFVVVDPMLAGDGDGDGDGDGGGGGGMMLQVPSGHCWTAGDNLGCSKDSRYYGPVPLALVRGKVVARLWPRMGWFAGAVREVGG